MRSFKAILFLLLISRAINVSAQYYNTGQDPSSIKWMQIKTNHFTVIYPGKYGSEGLTFARSLDKAYSSLTNIFPERRIKIPVIIHNYTTRSNGYVAWAPKRMEIYPTPEQNTIPLDPDMQLSVHEMAHVYQMSSLDQGFSKALSFILGEQVIGITSSLLPLWLLEGDAVFAESYLTESGRGRTPSFLKQLKALTVEKGISYKYDKIINDSYRDFVPSYYETGFQMVTMATSQYGSQIWNRVLDFTAREPFTINPVNISLQRNAHLTKKKLYNETLDTLKQIWTREIQENKSIAYNPVNPEKNNKFINYYTPLQAGKDSIISIKTSLSDPPAFVLITPSKGIEKKLFIPGYIYPYFISYGKGRLVWVENQPDKRWENREYSIIRILDIKKNQVRRLSKKTRYMAAAISPDGTRIAAIENSIENKNSLVFIDPETGAVQESAPVPGNAYLQHPQWAPGGNEITFISLTEQGEGILAYSVHNNTWDKLIDEGRADLQSSYLRNDTLFFISSETGTDNILAKSPGNKILKLTSSRFGASDLSMYGNEIIFSDYTADGNNICIVPATGIRDSVTVSHVSSSPLLDRLDQKPVTGSQAAMREYTPVPYRKWQHLFRFHSWMPFYADLETVRTDPASIRPGISLMSQNSLSTLTSIVGYEYSSTGKHVFHTHLTWTGWYPVIESRIDYGEAPQVYKLGESVNDPPSVQPLTRFSNSVRFPFRFSSGRFQQYLQGSLSTDYINKYIYIKEDGIYDYGQTILSGRLYFSNSSISAYRDIFPRWAQYIDINYSYAPFDRNIYGNITSIRTAFYLPGFLKNNSIRLRFEAEKQQPSRYFFSSAVSFPRGYSNILSTKINFLSADYVCPLIYPDLNLSGLLYIKRIRADIFYDHASGTDNYYLNVLVNGDYTNEFHAGNETFSSFGLELMSDFHLFRIPFTISGGIRTAWKDISQKPFVGFLFNMDLFGFSIGRGGI